MDFDNRSPFHAEFLKTSFGERRMLGCVICRATFRIEEGQLVPTPEDPFPIDMKPFDTPLGEFPGDMPFLTGGVDVLLGATAHAPAGTQVRSLRVDLQVGSRFQRSFAVFGDRRWQRSGDGWSVSEPEPFVEMPLTYENAFGGSFVVEDDEVDWPSNPEGKGACPTGESDDDVWLPNVEDPDNLIRDIRDCPDPVGGEVYPREWLMKPLDAIDLHVDDEDSNQTRIKRIKPRIFNVAHPKMIIPPREAPQPGEWVVLTHANPGGALQFQIPAVPLHAQVRLEDRHYLFPLHLDQIGIVADAQRVFMGFRVAFKYRLVRMERRQTTLNLGPLPQSVPTEHSQVKAPTCKPEA